MIQAFIIYFGLLFVLLSISIRGNFYFLEQGPNSDRNYFRVSVISIILFSLIIGLRYYVGGDYPSYLNDFVFFNLNYESFSDSRYSIGYYFLMYLLHWFGLPFPFLFLTVSLLQILYIYKWNHSNKFLLPWIIFFYFTTLYLFESMNIMRQAISFSMILYSIHYTLHLT